jgi:hypothetical protein
MEVERLRVTPLFAEFLSFRFVDARGRPGLRLVR